MAIRHLPSIYSDLFFKNLRRDYPTVFLIPEGKGTWLAYYRGLKFHISTPDARLLHAISEPYERHFEAGGIVVDVGARIGEQTLPYALKAKRVFALEPNEEMVEYLLKNVKMNGLKNIDVIRKAAWRNRGTLKIGKDKIEAEPLKDLIPVEIDFLKIDAEGAELEILKGADLDSVRKVALEVHGTEREVLRFLRGEGFEVLFEDRYIYARKL